MKKTNTTNEMKNITFEFQHGEQKSFTLPIIKTDQQTLVVSEFLNGAEIMCIKLTHPHLQTLLDVSNIENYILYSFDETKKLEGISYCHSPKGEDFKLLNQGKWLVFEKMNK